MASSGELRYNARRGAILGKSLSARGWMWLFEDRQWRFSPALGSVAAMAPLLRTPLIRWFP